MKHFAVEAEEFESVTDGSLVGPQGLSEKHRALRVLVQEVESQHRARDNDVIECLARVRSAIKGRRMRGDFFEESLFADPAWDILLELYSAELAQQRVPVGSLCAGAAVPVTTALRWIALLEQRGLIRRTADPMDGRRFFLSLSESAATKMKDYFSAVAPVAL